VFELALRRFQEEAFGFKEVKEVMDNTLVEGEVISCHDKDVVHVDEEHSWVLVF
jgi:hypothetical protein